MKGNDTKRKILCSGIHLFGQHGYNNVSMKDIAERAGMQPGSLYNHFKSKKALFDTIIDNADIFIKHLYLSSDMILEMLQYQTPAQILKQFVTYYENAGSTFIRSLYRLVFMEMYNSPRVLGIAHQNFILQPTKNIAHAMDCLAEAGAIPRGDNVAIAELWNRTSLIYNCIDNHSPSSISFEEYNAMTDFFIDMAVRGVRAIPVDRIEMNWEAFPFLPKPCTASKSTTSLILRKALEQFSRYGYTNTSMRQIAQAAGIRASSIYNHFASKESLMECLVKTFLASLQQYNPGKSSFSSILESRDIQHIVLSLSCSYPPVDREDLRNIYRILFREQYNNNQLGRFFVDSLEQDKAVVIHTIDNLVAQNKIHPCESRKIATAYVHLMCSLSIEATMEDTITNKDMLRIRTVAQLISIILYGYLDAPLPVFAS